MSRVRLALTMALALTPAWAGAQTFWTGPPIQFSKPAFADHTLPQNQDRITATTWITRNTLQGIFNIALESGYVGGVSPANTEWAPGSIADGVETLTFTDWRTAVDFNPLSSVNDPLVMHILDDDIYVDVMFVSWGSQVPGGGAFSYVRSTPPPVIPSIGRTGAAALALALVAVARCARRR